MSNSNTIKRILTQAAKAGIEARLKDHVRVLNRPCTEEVNYFEVTEPGPNTLMVRLRQATGTRYFEIKISEKV